jgi:hypothetical protein
MTNSPSDAIEESIPRAFHALADAPNYLVLADANGGVTAVWLRCKCGLHRELFPDSLGVVEYRHRFWKCKWKARLRLEGYTDLFLTKAELKEKRKHDD